MRGTIVGVLHERRRSKGARARSRWDGLTYLRPLAPAISQISTYRVKPECVPLGFTPFLSGVVLRSRITPRWRRRACQGLLSSQLFSFPASERCNSLLPVNEYTRRKTYCTVAISIASIFAARISISDQFRLGCWRPSRASARIPPRAPALQGRDAPTRIGITSTRVRHALRGEARRCRPPGPSPASEPTRAPGCSSW